jgi:hypothetical protein
MVNHACLLQKLNLIYKFSSAGCRLFQNFLNGRTQLVKFRDDLLKPITLNCGLRQGIVLAQTLFGLFINDLDSVVQESVPNYFADDCQLQIAGPMKDFCRLIRFDL